MTMFSKVKFFISIVSRSVRPVCYSTIAEPIEQPHTPVMLKEVLQHFEPEENQTYVDMTFGAGGHSKSLLQSFPSVKVFGLDRDSVAYDLAQLLAVNYPGQLTPLHGKFSDLPSLLREYGVKQGTVDGILFDFGCSSMQFDVADRGFSINKNGPLDMRMDKNSNNPDPTAAEVLQCIEEEDLCKVLRVYGEEKQAKKVARAVIEARYTGVPLRTTQDLSELVAAACGSDHRLNKLQRHSHSATKVFQALRILVNNEVNEINYGMIIAHRYLKVGGKLVTLSFHSLEDKIVKRHIYGNVIDNAINPLSLKYTDTSLWFGKEEVELFTESGWKQMNKHVLTPTDEEVLLNPRSRSAKLRAAVKIK